jgi:RHS repeat-associated protein
MKNTIILLSFLIYSASYINAQDTISESMFDFTSKAKVKKKEKLNDSPYAMFGDNTTVLKTDHERNLDHSLKIPLLEDDKQIGLFELNFQTGVVTIKDANGILVLNQELSQDQLGRFLSIDPLAEKYYSWSPYVYVMNNPMKYIDPDGCSTWVMQNSDGTYRVVGGDLEDKDYNIYVYTIDKDKGLVRGNSIGVTTSMTSFYNTDANDGKGSWVTGATINPNDKSGESFWGNIVGNTPSLDDYMKNATGGKPYDFKTTNGTNQKLYNTEVEMYRGMPIGSFKGQAVYTSARDIGNMAAGYVAGANGMPWGASRAAFDVLQSYQDGRPSIEGSSTRNAERFGWNLGQGNVPPLKKLENLKRAINNFFGF